MTLMNPPAGGWLTDARGQKVDRVPCPFPGERLIDGPATGVLHTTEGSYESALSVFKQHYAPHFLVGRDGRDFVRVTQLMPLGYMATALEHASGRPETNRVADVQIELVGFSKMSPWCCDAGVLDALACLLAELSKRGLPLTRPFPESMPPPPWATTSFIRRSAPFWGKVPGWYGHVEVPGNSHWDPGAFQWGKLLAAAKKRLPPPAPAWYVKASALSPMWAWIVWKDNGQPTLWRPKQIPDRVPKTWFARYLLHKGT